MQLIYIQEFKLQIERNKPILLLDAINYELSSFESLTIRIQEEPETKARNLSNLFN